MSYQRHSGPDSLRGNYNRGIANEVERLRPVVLRNAKHESNPKSSNPKSCIAVRDLVARGYFILGRTSQRGRGRAHAFRVACCRTHQGSGFDGLGWVLLGPKWARPGPVWSFIWVPTGSSGPVGPYRVPTGFRRNPVLARRDLSGFDGSLDCPVSMHD